MGLMKNVKPAKARLPVFAQLTHANGLNDVCDALRIHARWLGSLRGAMCAWCMLGSF
jgi:hypothetical protein